MVHAEGLGDLPGALIAQKPFPGFLLLMGVELGLASEHCALGLGGHPAVVLPFYDALPFICCTISGKSDIKVQGGMRPAPS